MLWVVFRAPDGGTPVLPEVPAEGDVLVWFGRYRAMPEAQRTWMRSYPA